MEKGNFYMQIKLYMKEIGKMIRLMVMEFSYTQIKLDIQVNGKMIFNTDMEKKIGLMAQYIKEILKKVKSMDKVLILLQFIGNYVWNDGSQYSGEWSENKINGVGTYIWYLFENKV